MPVHPHRPRQPVHATRPAPTALLAAICVLLPAAASEPPALTPGQAVDGELAGGRSRELVAELPGEAVFVVAVDQLGVDLVVAVEAPGGASVATVDSPRDRRGRETVLLEPERAGRYRIRLTAREPGAPPGRFAVRLERLDETVGERLAAHRALTRAGRAYHEGSPEGLRRALAHYREAAAILGRLGLTTPEAHSLYAAAVVARLGEETALALELATRAQAGFRAEGEELWEAVALKERGLALWLSGKTSAAREAFGEALDRFRDVDDPYGEAVARANLCLLDLVAGELRAGLTCYSEAFPRLEAVGAAELTAAAHLNAGRARDVLGEPERAREHYREALDLLAVAGDRRGEARTRNNLAVLHRQRGEIRRALLEYGRALDLFRQLEDRRWQARVLRNLALLYHRLGEVERAREQLEEALALERTVDDPRGEAATLVRLGRLLLELGEPATAETHQHRALALYRQLEDRRGAAIAAGEIARLELAGGRLEAARQRLEVARSTFETIGDLPNRVKMLTLTGRLELAVGAPEKARVVLAKAAELAHRAELPAEAAWVHLELARTERRLGRSGAARAAVTTALDLFEAERRSVPGPDLRASFLGRRHRAYELAVDLAMEAHRSEPTAGHQATAFHLAERARARALLDLLARSGTDLWERSDPDLAERRRRLLARLDRLSGQITRADGEAREALVAERHRRLTELDLLEAETRTASPDYAELTRPLEAAGVRHRLDPDTVLLAYWLGAERSVLWWVSRDGVAAFALPAGPLIEDLVRDLHQRLADPDPAGRATDARRAAELSGMLLAPVAERLTDQRLAVVAHGAVHYVPFGALPHPAADDGPPTPLLARHEIVYLPSASILPALERRLARPRGTGIAVLADPVFGAEDPRLEAGPRAHRGEPSPPPPTLPRLPATRREAEVLLELAPSGERLVALGFEARRDRVVDGALAPYRYLHLATHGVLDAGRPALSGLMLSRRNAAGEPIAGFLGLEEIFRLELAADLVVLSGCETALGEAIRGEGLVGLTRGFVQAGVPRVVASLWRVEDRATAELMERFYRYLWTEALPPAAALRQARLELARSRRYRDPAHWAGFVFHGTWQGLEAGEERRAGDPPPPVRSSDPPSHRSDRGASRWRAP